jgi:hypothetical protein
MNAAGPERISDEEARRLAREIAGILLSPVIAAKAEFPEQEYTLADLIRAGAAMLGPINQAFEHEGVKEQNREFFEALMASLRSPEVFEKFLFRKIKEGSENPPDLDAALSEVARFLGDPGRARRMIRSAMDDAFPKGPRGRPSNFNPAQDAHRFLAMSERLVPGCEQLLILQMTLPDRTTADIVEFIESGSTVSTVSMRKYADFIDEIMHEEEFRALKANSTRARRIAEAIIGKELFGWSLVYSAQKANEFRRAAKRESEE